MVEVIQRPSSEHVGYGGGQPLVHIHYIERFVHGSGIGIKVYGEAKMAAKQVLFARELKLNTIQVLLLTPETGRHTGYIAQNWIYNKGEYGNYASVDVITDAGTEVTAGTGPSDGSIWLNFIAIGE